MSESFSIKLQALRTTTLLKRNSCEICEIFKNTLFYWTSPEAASGSFRFPAGNLIKETPTKMFICEFWKIFKNIFWQNTSGWLLLVNTRSSHPELCFESCESWNSVNFWICEFWEVFQITSFIEGLWETVYFLYKLDKLSNFNHQVQANSIRISQVLFKGFIQVKEVAIRRRSFTYNPWKLSLKKLICNEVARSRSSHPEVFLRKGVLKKYAANLQRNTHGEVQFQ